MILFHESTYMKTKDGLIPKDIAKFSDVVSELNQGVGPQGAAVGKQVIKAVKDATGIELTETTEEQAGAVVFALDKDRLWQINNWFKRNGELVNSTIFAEMQADGMAVRA